MSTPPAEEAGRTPDLLDVQRVLQGLVAVRQLAECAVRVGLVQNFADVELFPEEAAAVAKAVPRRVATFRASRGCARAALKELGSTGVAIPVGASGAPIWPDEFVGSIAHTNEIAAAVVARKEQVKGLGLDIETGEPLDDAKMLKIVCRPEEVLPGLEAAAPENLQRGKLIFVVKEAVYKLYWPLAGAFLEFDDLAVSLDETAGTFRASIANSLRPAAADLRSFTGVFAKAEGLVFGLTSLT